MSQRSDKDIPRTKHHIKQSFWANSFIIRGFRIHVVSENREKHKTNEIDISRNGCVLVLWPWFCCSSKILFVCFTELPCRCVCLISVDSSVICLSLFFVFIQRNWPDWIWFDLFRSALFSNYVLLNDFTIDNFARTIKWGSIYIKPVLFFLFSTSAELLFFLLHLTVLSADYINKIFSIKHIKVLNISLV